LLVENVNVGLRPDKATMRRHTPIASKYSGKRLALIHELVDFLVER
jgi:hypothetical protein